MAFNSSYEPLCLSYDHNSNDFSLDINRSIVELQMHTGEGFLQLVLYLISNDALKTGSEPLSNLED